MTTGAMILARKMNDKAAFDQALDAWLTGRRVYPENWLNDLLDVPEFARWLADVDPQRLAAPVIAVPQLTDEDRAFVSDLDGARLAAVTENIEWLRVMGHTGTAAAIAAKYQLVFVNRSLQEATLQGLDDLPDLIVVLNADGSFSGSFISH